MEEYLSRARYVTNTSFVDEIIHNDDIENVHYVNVTFHNVAYSNMKLGQVEFEMCNFDMCVFENVKSRRTYFRDSFVKNSTFNHTDFYKSRFPVSTLLDTRFYATKDGCQVDFDYNFSQRYIFFESFISQLAVIPSSVLSAFLLNRFGRVPIFGK